MPTIRRAQLADAPLLPPIERSSGETFRSWPGLEWIADDAVQSEDRHRALIGQGAAWVATDSAATPIGFLNGEAAGEAFHIWQMAVHHRQQRRGIGTALLAAATASARQRGFRRLTLTTFRDVPWNAPWYHRQGFLMIPEHALGQRLQRILQDEGDAGLPLSRRCAMQRRLSGP